MSERKRRPTTVTRAIEAESLGDDLTIVMIAREVQARGETAQIIKSLAGCIVAVFRANGADLTSWLDQLDTAWEQMDRQDVEAGLDQVQRFLRDQKPD